ncbi:MAG: hypothetical protein JWQ98_188 [Chlorobi bacterium]|nr:hypothetical protein [Chlorobiota bacterium]
MESLTLRSALAIAFCASCTLGGCVTITNIYPGGQVAAGANPQTSGGNSAAAYPGYPQYAPPYYDPAYSNHYYYPPYSPNYSWYYPGDNYYYYPGQQSQRPPQNNGGLTDNGGTAPANSRESTVRRNPSASHPIDSADPFRADVHRDRPASVGSEEPFSHKTGEKPKGDSPVADRNPVVSGRDDSPPRRDTPVERTGDGRSDILHGRPDTKQTTGASDPRREQPASTGASTPTASAQHHDLSGSLAESSKPAGVESEAHRDSVIRRATDEKKQASQGSAVESDARRKASPTTTAPVVKASEGHNSSVSSQITAPIKNETPVQSEKAGTEQKKEAPAAGTSAVRRDAGAVGAGVKVGTTSKVAPVATRNESGNATDPAATSSGVKND